MYEGVFSQTKGRTGTKEKEPQIIPKSDGLTKKNAIVAFNAGNYAVALPHYLSLQKAKPQSIEYNYRAGICILFTNHDKSKAIPFLEFVAKEKNPEKEIYYYLARAYHYVHRFDDAITNYEKYKQISKSTKTLMKSDVDRQIEMCNNGKELLKKPLNVTFENLGKNINTPFSDYNPFITSDESTLIFSSRRKGTTGNAVDEEEGTATSDIFISVMKEGNWTKAKPVSTSVNTFYDEDILWLSGDGQTMLIYMDTPDVSGDIAMTTAKGKTWQKPELLSPTVNSEEVESGATISFDGQTIYFSSDKNGGYGGKDIYMAHILPDGSWSPAVNLEEPVNTEYDEDAPYISNDGKTLYYSSKGHNSMGGFDIFRSIFDDSTDTWSTPENIGYPINTADDNLYFSISGQGKYVYISAVRPDGFGELDIYKVNFKEIPRNNYQTIIRGTLSASDSSKNISAVVFCTDKKTGEVVGQYSPSPASGRFIIPLYPGEYQISIAAEGYKEHMEEFVIPELKQPNFIDKPIILKK